MSTSAANEIKSSRRNKRGRAENAKPMPPTSASSQTAAPSIVPLKPRRRLFFVLLGVLALWIAVLIYLYFDTVYPQLHH